MSLFRSRGKHISRRPSGRVEATSSATLQQPDLCPSGQSATVSWDKRQTWRGAWGSINSGPFRLLCCNRIRKMLPFLTSLNPVTGSVSLEYELGSGGQAENTKSFRADSLMSSQTQLPWPQDIRSELFKPNRKIGTVT